eukprot:g3722.t1
MGIIQTLLGLDDPGAVELRKKLNCPLTDEDLEEIKMVSPFTDKKIVTLWDIFNYYDSDNDGQLILDEFVAIEEIKTSPLKDRLTEVCKQYGDSVEFKEFVMFASVFSLEGPRDQKLKTAFKIYDVDGDGQISKKDLTHILNLIMIVDEAKPKNNEEKKPEGAVEEKKKDDNGENKTDEKSKDSGTEIPEYLRDRNSFIKELVDRTFQEVTSAGMLSFDDFTKVMIHCDYHQKLVIDFTKPKIKTNSSRMGSVVAPEGNDKKGDTGGGAKKNKEEQKKKDEGKEEKVDKKENEQDEKEKTNTTKDDDEGTGGDQGEFVEDDDQEGVTETKITASTMFRTETDDMENADEDMQVEGKTSSPDTTEFDDNDDTQNVDDDDDL